MAKTLEIIVILLVLSSYRSAANVKRDLDNYLMTMWTMWTILFRYSKKTILPQLEKIPQSFDNEQDSRSQRAFV